MLIKIWTPQTIILPAMTVVASDSDHGFEYHDPVTVAVQDSVTGEVVTVSDISTWQWTEGNWSCDCNRWDYFDVDEPDDSPCVCERFRVIWFDEGSPSAKGYTLDEFNGGYDCPS